MSNEMAFSSDLWSGRDLWWWWFFCTALHCIIEENGSVSSSPVQSSLDYIVHFVVQSVVRPVSGNIFPDHDALVYDRFMLDYKDGRALR